MNLCKGFWECISPDAWVTSVGTLLGAFLGALIAGLITLKAIKYQLEENQKESRINSLKNFVEVFTEISWTLDSVIINLKDIKNEMKKVNPDENRIKELLDYHTYINRSYEYFNQLNYISLDVNITIRINVLKNLLLSIRGLNYSFNEEGKVNQRTVDEFDLLLEKLIEGFEALKDKDKRAINELKESGISIF